MLFNRTVWSDWRLLLAVPVAIGLRLVMDAAYTSDLDYGDDAATSAADERLFDDHAYRPPPSAPEGPEWSMSPMTVALGGGGIVFALGALLALRMWRDAEASEQPGRGGWEADDAGPHDLDVR